MGLGGGVTSLRSEDDGVLLEIDTCVLLLPRDLYNSWL